MLDRTRVTTAFAAIRALTDEEYAFVTQFVRTPATTAAPATKANGPLSGRAPKGSALASERAKKAWKTRKKNEKKRASQVEDSNGPTPGSALDAAS